jgi:hypothetical protein
MREIQCKSVTAQCAGALPEVAFAVVHHVAVVGVDVQHLHTDMQTSIHAYRLRFVRVCMHAYQAVAAPVGDSCQRTHVHCLQANAHCRQKRVQVIHNPNSCNIQPTSTQTVESQQ